MNRHQVNIESRNCEMCPAGGRRPLNVEGVLLSERCPLDTDVYSKREASLVCAGCAQQERGAIGM